MARFAVMLSPVHPSALLLRLVIVGTVVGGPTFIGLIAECAPVRAAESADVYLSVAGVGGFPESRGMSLAGRATDELDIHTSIGGGLKVGIFPQWTQRALGLELEYFGTAGRVSTRSVHNGNASEGRAGLIVLNSMFNVVLRKPSGAIRPYGGGGIGYSSGILYDSDLPGRANRGFDSTPGFSYQFLGGVQWDIGARVFLFTEYKYLVTAFHWKGAALDHHAHYALAGLGWSF